MRTEEIELDEEQEAALDRAWQNPPPRQQAQDVEPEPNPKLVEKLVELVKRRLFEDTSYLDGADKGSLKEEEQEEDGGDEEELLTAEEVLSSKSLAVDVKAKQPTKPNKDPHPVRHGGPCLPGERADMTGCTPKKKPQKRDFPRRGVNEKPNKVSSAEKQKLVAQAHATVKEVYARLKEGKAPTKAQFKSLGQELKHLNWATLRSLHARMIGDEQVARKRHRVKNLLAYAKKMSADKPKAKPTVGSKPRATAAQKKAAVKKKLDQIKKLPPKAKSTARRIGSWLAKATGKAASMGAKLAVGAMAKTIELLKGAPKGKGKKPPKGKKPAKPKLKPKVPVKVKEDVGSLVDMVADAGYGGSGGGGRSSRGSGGGGGGLSSGERSAVIGGLLSWLLSWIYPGGARGR